MKYNMEHIQVKRKTDQLLISHKLEKQEQINMMAMEILNRGEIEALLPIRCKRSFFSQFLQCEVQGIADLRSYLKSNLPFDQFSMVILQLINIFQECEVRGIPYANLQLDPDLSFFDYRSRQVHMIYWPLISFVQPNYLSFFQEVGAAYISSQEDSTYRVRYLNYFNHMFRFDLEDLKQHIIRLLSHWMDEKTNKAAVQPVEPEEDVPDEEKTISMWEKKAGPEEVVLYRVATATEIMVHKYPFVIGRKPEFCDWAIENNLSISKRHAMITLRNGHIYIKDHGSTNGTRIERLNSGALPAHTEIELIANDRFMLGNEEFIIRF